MSEHQPEAERADETGSSEPEALPDLDVSEPDAESVRGGNEPTHGDKFK